MCFKVDVIREIHFKYVFADQLPNFIVYSQ